jgi:hypothetical protein
MEPDLTPRRHLGDPGEYERQIRALECQGPEAPRSCVSGLGFTLCARQATGAGDFPFLADVTATDLLPGEKEARLMLETPGRQRDNCFYCPQ